MSCRAGGRTEEAESRSDFLTARSRLLFRSFRPPVRHQTPSRLNCDVAGVVQRLVASSRRHLPRRGQPLPAPPPPPPRRRRCRRRQPHPHPRNRLLFRSPPQHRLPPLPLLPRTPPLTQKRWTTPAASPRRRGCFRRSFHDEDGRRAAREPPLPARRRSPRKSSYPAAPWTAGRTGRRSSRAARRSCDERRQRERSRKISNRLLEPSTSV